jgi:drug/metabolite transporter (DMT)-like permease
MVKRLFVAGLLFACAGVFVLELSGHWDRTLSDANDEVGLVAVVLCVGVAIAAARTLLKTIRERARKSVVVATLTARIQSSPSRLSVSSILFTGPPLPLRI